MKFKYFLKKTCVFTALFLGCFFLSGFKAPQNQGYVTDPAHVLTAQQKQVLEQVSYELEQKTGVQVATAILPTIGDYTVEDYANRLFEAWGIGQKDKDNGLLFLIALKERKLRIEVGYGLEGILPDGKAGAIRDTVILPYFKVGDNAAGILAGHYALAATIAEALKVQLTPIEQQAVATQSSSTQGAPSQGSQAFVLLILAAIVVAMVVSPTFRGFMLGFVLASLLQGGSGRSSHSGHFGGGGGFGGFGGGGSGGGGASGGW
jgi:uncharacterized protein